MIKFLLYNAPMFKNILKKTLILLSIVILFFNCCCAKNVWTETPITTNTKIAIVGPLTGPYSAYGKQLLFAANQAIMDLNLQTHHLEIVPFDDQCNPDLAKSVANKITKDSKFKAVIGHSCSAATIATNKIYAKHGILNVTPTSTNPNITEQNISTLFRMCGRDDIQAQYISNFLSKKFNNKKIAILHSQDLYSKELAEYVQESLAMLKISTTLYQSITADHLNNHTKIKAILKKTKKLNIDVIFFAGLYQEAANIIKTMHHNQIKILMIASDSIATPGFIEKLGSSKLAAGTMMSFQKIDLKDNKIDSKIEDSKIQGQGLFGYAAIQIINTAIQNYYDTNNNVNNLNGRILAHWLHQNKINTILGEKSWDTNGDVIDAEFTMYMWDENGKYWPML